MARVGCVLFGTGAVLGLVALLSSDPSDAAVSSWVTTGLSLLVAVGIAWGHRFLPRGWEHVAAVFGTMNTAAAMWFDPFVRSAPESGAFVMLLWVCLFVACFSSVQAALAHGAFVGVVLLVLLMDRPPPMGAVASWVMTMGAYAVASGIVFAKQARLRELAEREARAARTDFLTELPNRRAATEWLERSGDGELAMIVVDLDHFKRVNDQRGHEHGDVVLHRVAGVLRTFCRPDDLIARMGGEEFLVVLGATGPDAAMRVAERLRAAVESEFGDHRPAVTASVGVSAGRVRHGIAELQAAADAAVYAAKGQGRNRTVFQSPRCGGP